jgi:hypothetical protein
MCVGSVSVKQVALYADAQITSSKLRYETTETMLGQATAD